jgi:hypothetical protein
MRRFCPDKKTYIGQLELLAAIVVYWSLSWLRGRRSFHWIDNQGAIACLIKGYASAPDCLPMLHAWVSFALRHCLRPWFMYVPSKANIADLPSRLSYELLRTLGAAVGPLAFPPFEAWDRPPRVWLDAALDVSRSTHPLSCGTVSIGNLRVAAARDGDFRVDRNTGSPLGNPFAMRSEAGRELVCDLCDQVMASDEPLLVSSLAQRHGVPVSPGYGPEAHQARRNAIEALAMRVAAGADVRLMCHCFPRRCHAHGIARLVRTRAAALFASAASSRKRLR